MNSSTLPASGAAIRLDDLDHRILDELSRDGRLSNTDLAHRIGLSPSACWTRVRALEENGGFWGPIHTLTVHHLFINRPLPKCPGDSASGLFAEALHKVFYEFNIGTIRKNHRKLFVCSGKYAVSAIVSSVDNLNVFHGTFTMSIVESSLILDPLLSTLWRHWPPGSFVEACGGVCTARSTR